MIHEYTLQPSPTRTGDKLHSDLPGYAEGLWTPNVGGNATYLVQEGTYTKIGRMVFITGIIQINAIGTGSTNVISGLPFPSRDSPTGNGSICFVVRALTSVTAIVSIVGDLGNNQSDISLRSRVAANASDALNAIFQNSTIVEITGFYPI